MPFPSTSALHTGYLLLEGWLMYVGFFCRGNRLDGLRSACGCELKSYKKGNTNHEVKVKNLHLAAAMEQGCLAFSRQAHLFPTYLYAVCVKA
jgi:hypothetical protein